VVIVVDSSVWIDHFRRSEPAMRDHLSRESVAVHPLVVEELACGQLSPRREILEQLKRMPPAPVASHEEVLALIAGESLFAKGLSAVDVHLLASARLGRMSLWTRDKALQAAAIRFHLA
jgi:predicted nucleic acid-binding protein